MIDITYSLSEPEYQEAYGIWAKLQMKGYPGRILTHVAGAIFGGFIGISLHFLPAWSWIGLISSYTLLYLICWWRKKAIRKHLYAQSKERWQSLHAQIDELGFQSEKPDWSGGWIRWSQFTRSWEGKFVFVLGYDVHFVAIPKTALSPEQQSELRSLISSHLKSTA